MCLRGAFCSADDIVSQIHLILTQHFPQTLSFESDWGKFITNLHLKRFWHNRTTIIATQLLHKHPYYMNNVTRTQNVTGQKL